MALEPEQQLAKEGFDLFPEHANSHQYGCEGSDDSLNDYAASSRVYVEASSSRQI